MVDPVREPRRLLRRLWSQAPDATPVELLTPPPGLALVPPASAPSPPRLLDRVRHTIRTLHYSRRTEKAYVYWIRRFIFHHGVRNPAEMGVDEIRAFLSHLAVNEHVGASTQNQALCALVFLYGRVLGRSMEFIEGIERAKAPRRLPVVLTRGEVSALLERMEGVPQLVCLLLYGAGLRLLECLSLRVKDLDFERHELTVRDGKGAKDRISMLPQSFRHDLLGHLDKVRQLHREDLARGLGRAPMPYALAEKYPNADRQWGWQYIFPASSFYTDRDTGARHRHHLHETVVQKAMSEAVRRAQLAKPATPHTLRHCAGSGISVTASPRTSWRTARMSGRSRPCSATGVC